jgi:hypothetical protein
MMAGQFQRVMQVVQLLLKLETDKKIRVFGPTIEVATIIENLLYGEWVKEGNDGQ